jgi:NADP-dependent 3-hydroxy acid dehydrogenase YdfG
MTQNIKDKVVVITGASSGLGEATSRLLASQGAIVVLGARREDRIKNLAEVIAAEGGTALAAYFGERDRRFRERDRFCGFDVARC